MALPLLPILLIGGAAVAALAMASGQRAAPPAPGWTKRYGTLHDSDGLTQEWETQYWSEAQERARATEAAADGRDYPYDAESVGWSYSVSTLRDEWSPLKGIGLCCYPTEQAAIDALRSEDWHTDFREFT